MLGEMGTLFCSALQKRTKSIQTHDWKNWFFLQCKPNNLPCLWHAFSSWEACTSIFIILWKVRCGTFCSRLLAFLKWQQQELWTRIAKAKCVFAFCKATRRDCAKRVPLIAHSVMWWLTHRCLCLCLGSQLSGLLFSDRQRMPHTSGPPS